MIDPWLGLNWKWWQRVLEQHNQNMTFLEGWVRVSNCSSKEYAPCTVRSEILWPAVSLSLLVMFRKPHRIIVIMFLRLLDLWLVCYFENILRNFVNTVNYRVLSTFILEGCVFCAVVSIGCCQSSEAVKTRILRPRNHRHHRQDRTCSGSISRNRNPCPS